MLITHSVFKQKNAQHDVNQAPVVCPAQGDFGIVFTAAYNGWKVSSNTPERWIGHSLLSVVVDASVNPCLSAMLTLRYGYIIM